MAMLSFFVLALSSVILYLIPDRKVTSWSDWKFIGLDKQQWDNLHINLGILFLFTAIWHIYFNWKPIKNYLKVKKKLKVFTKEFNVALFITSLFVVGTITMTLPFSFLVNIGNGIKSIKSLDIGNPPFGYAEYASLKDFCIITSTNLQESLQRLKAKNIKVNSTKDTLKTISKENGISPKELFAIIKTSESKIALPSELPIGIAQKSLIQLSKEYHIDTDKFLKHLKEYDIKATNDMNFKKIAKKNGLHPAQLYNMLLASQYK